MQTYSGPFGGPPAPLHPAASRADWGRSTPGQEEPRGGWRSDGVGKTLFFYQTIGLSSSGEPTLILLVIILAYF